jgi:hypothetical protein
MARGGAARALGQDVGGEVPEPAGRSGKLGRFLEDPGCRACVVEEDEVGEAQVLAQPPVPRQRLRAALEQGDGFPGLARASRPRLREEDGAVSVGDLHSRVERHRHVDQGLEQPEVAATGVGALASVVLDRAQPVDVGRQGLEPGRHPADLIGGPQVQRFLLAADLADAPVELGLQDGHEREERGAEQARAHENSLRRNAHRPAHSVRAT